MSGYWGVTATLLVGSRPVATVGVDHEGHLYIADPTDDDRAIYPELDSGLDPTDPDQVAAAIADAALALPPF